MEKTKSGKYREKIYVNGTEVKSPSFKRKSDALAWKRESLSQRDKFIARGGRGFRKVRFSVYSDEYLKKVVANHNSPRTYEVYESNLRKHVNPFMGNKYLHDINSDDGFNLISQIKKSGDYKPKTINLILMTVKRILNQAVSDNILGVNPLNSVKFLKEPPKPDVYMNQLEINQFLSANLRSELYPLFVVALNSGMRKGELAGLLLDRVNIKTGFIEVTRTRDRKGLRETTKTNEKRFVPMNAEVRRVVLDIVRSGRTNSYVFTKFDGSPVNPHHLYREFREAQKKAGFTKFYRFHDMRHTFASQFMMNGGSIYDLQKIMGHTDIKTTQRYAHLSPNHLSSAVDIIGFSGVDRTNTGHHDLEPESKFSDFDNLMMMN